MFTRLRIGYGYWRLGSALAPVLDLPAARLRPGGVTVVSMLCGRDILMYLLAAKSFALRTPVSGFVVLDDGTLTDQHRALLTRHVPSVTVTPIADIRTSGTPRGNCWERLNRIVELAETRYVIQLDADTVTLGPIPEIEQCVASGTAFTLVSEADTRIVTLSQAAEFAERHPSSHVQIAAERALGALDPGIGARYVRGCAAFTGFPPGSWRHDMLGRLSAAMERQLGARWTEWGTEQVASSFLAANAPTVQLLPFPGYCNFSGDPVDDDSVFIHCIGTYRFKNGGYRRISTRCLNTISKLSPAAQSG